MIGRAGPYRVVALLEDERVAEVYFEEEASRELVGSVYVGRVQRYLPGMDCAFVELGLSRTAYLPTRNFRWQALVAASAREVSSLLDEADPSRDEQARLREHLQPGRRVLVQVERSPVGDKGARLTTDLGLAGRLGVYFPFGAGVGVSQRIDSAAERERLRVAASSVAPAEGGFVVRTAARGSDAEALQADVDGLRARWAGLREAARTASAPSRLYAEPAVALRALRELLGPSARHVWVEPHEADAVRDFVRLEVESMQGAVIVWERGGSLLAAKGVYAAVEGALAREVPLPSGGSIVIEHTEALTVVDVNSGQYTGRVDLRQTALRTNLEAAGRLAQQLRLRNIGGLIVVDFIDMGVPEDRRAVDEALRDALARDRAKVRVLPMSDFGLVELTRQRLRPALATMLQAPCGHCGGLGQIDNGVWAALSAVRRVSESAGPGVRLVRLEAPRRIVEALSRHYEQELAEIRERADLDVQLAPRSDLRHDEVRITAR